MLILALKRHPSLQSFRILYVSGSGILSRPDHGLEKLEVRGTCSPIEQDRPRACSWGREGCGLVSRMACRNPINQSGRDARARSPEPPGTAALEVRRPGSDGQDRSLLPRDPVMRRSGIGIEGQT